MNLKKIALTFVLFVLISLSFFYISKSLDVILESYYPSYSFLEIDKNYFKIEVVRSQKDQNIGLSGRKKLPKDEGMFFVFNEPSINYFWMKDMNFPISIIWFNEDFEVIFIEKNVSPKSYPQTFGPNEKSKYVLEVNTDFLEKNNLKIGDKVNFLP